MIRLGIIEDNAFVQDRLKTQFNKSDAFECVLVVDSVEKFLHFYRPYMEMDIILLDINLTGMSGIEGIPRLLHLHANWEIIMFTVHQDSDKIFKAICAGAAGYLLKDLTQAELEEQLIKIHEKGGALLSPKIARRILDYFQPRQKKVKHQSILLNEKELQVVRFLIDGLSYQQVGNKIGLSIDGVRYHVKNIYKKLQISSKSELMKLHLEGRFGFFGI